MSDLQQLPLSIQPVISYPREAQVGKTYLMTVDLQPSGDEWPYEEEEYAIYCMLETSPLFSSKPVGEPAVVLHRFGGTYGAAKFLLTAAQEEMEGEIRVTLVNGWGVPVRVLNLNNVVVKEKDINRSRAILSHESVYHVGRTDEPDRSEWSGYLESICQEYAQWWKIYTFTDVVEKQQDEQKQFSPLLDLMVQSVEQQQEKREEEKEKIERLAVVEGLRKYAPNHVLLIGRPGSGKSTALVRLLLEEAERGRAKGSEGDGDAPRIPVLVELRYYQHSVLERIKAFLLKHQPNLDVDKEILKQWLHQGRLLLLLDGFNELPSEDARQQVRVFRQNYPKTPMVFTTRDLGVGGDLNITKKLEMQPLTEAQMRQFVYAYLPQQGKQMLKQLGSRLREFGETPLFLWMLCSVFASNSNQIPSNLGSVFRRFTEIYDKQDILISEELRLWQQQLLQQLAWVMTQGKSETELFVAISIQEAKAKLTVFLQGKVDSPDNFASHQLEYLLNHHLIQFSTGNQIEFLHQLLQEYYTAEWLLKRLPNLSENELKWNYLNYQKWTEPLTMMLNLVEDEDQAVRVVYFALEVDFELGLRLAGVAKPTAALRALAQALQDENYDVRRSAVKALGKIGSDVAIPALIQALQDENYNVRRSAVKALGKIGSDVAIPALIQALQDEKHNVRRSAAEALGKIGSETAIQALIQVLQDENYNVRRSATEALGKIGSDAAVPALINPLSHNYALLIGIGESAYPQWSLPVAVKDIQALKFILVNPNLCSYIDDEQHLRLLHDAGATKESILDGLNWLQQQAAADSEATVLIYYSGHAWLDDSTGKYYLIPHDVTPFDFLNSSLPADTFTQALRQIPAKRLLVIIDSCHAAGMATAENEQAKLKLPGNFLPVALPKNLIEESKQGTGRAVFASSTGKQQSWVFPDSSMSIYTFHFLEALQGAGNQPGDKVVRVSNLMNYVGKTVSKTAQQLCQAEQTPFFDLAAEDFPIALLHGGKGLPQQGWDGVKSEAQKMIRSVSREANKVEVTKPNR